MKLGFPSIFNDQISSNKSPLFVQEFMTLVYIEKCIAYFHFRQLFLDKIGTMKRQDKASIKNTEYKWHECEMKLKHF